MSPFAHSGDDPDGLEGVGLNVHERIARRLDSTAVGRPGVEYAENAVEGVAGLRRPDGADDHGVAAARQSRGSTQDYNRLDGQQEAQRVGVRGRPHGLASYHGGKVVDGAGVIQEQSV